MINQHYYISAKKQAPNINLQSVYGLKYLSKCSACVVKLVNVFFLLFVSLGLAILPVC